MAETDFNIDNYEMGDLLHIFGITEPLQKEAIMKIADGFIQKYRDIKPAYAEFFSKAMNKIVSNYAQVEDTFKKAQDLLEEVSENKELLEEKLEEYQEQAEEIIENGMEWFEEKKKDANDFINQKADAAGANIFKNGIYNPGDLRSKVNTGVMPNRGDLTHVPPGLGSHVPQLRSRLTMPNAYAQIPHTQGYINPTLQNAYISWINVDSQYREILPTDMHSSNAIPPPPSPKTRVFDQHDGATDFLFNLNAPITNVMAMTIGSIEVPLAGYYAFSEMYGNTSFEIKIGDDSTCLRIPEGNYDASGIIQVINKEFDLIFSLNPNFHADNKPLMILDKSNNKVYFKIENMDTPIKFKWFDRSRCGSCNECMSVNNIIKGLIKKFGPGRDLRKNEYKCSDKNTGKKINSTLGWSLGFRESESVFQSENLFINPIADPSFYFAIPPVPCGAPVPMKTFIVGSSIWNELGTKYMILEVDDFNKNRNIGNMGTLSMPSSTENFKLPEYAKHVSQTYPICPSENDIQQTPLELVSQEIGLLKKNQPNQNIPLKYATLAGPVDIVGPVVVETNPKKGTYENFKRSCRKGTPPQEFGVKGQDTLTKAQKYTAKEITNTQRTSSVNQYYAPQATNILFRFPIQRLSDNLQAPMIIPNTAGLGNARRYFGPVTLEKLRIRLLDDKGFPVDLHGGEISFSLIVESLYQY
jgi:hypothetical protein